MHTGFATDVENVSPNREPSTARRNAVRKKPARAAPRPTLQDDPTAELCKAHARANTEDVVLDQTTVYLGEQCASDWLAVSDTPLYQQVFRARFPFDRVARLIGRVVRDRSVDLVTLGPGDGQGEVQMMQALVRHRPETAFRFYLVDACQLLLGRATHLAQTTFAAVPKVQVRPVFGNFYDLARLPALKSRPQQKPSLRIFTMIGFTFGNFHDEAAFVNQTFAGAQPGDLLLFDVQYPHTRSRKPEVIRERDGAFRTAPTVLRRRWLEGPVRRGCEGLIEADSILELDQSGTMAASYGIRYIVVARFENGQTKRFHMWSVRRYHPRGLAAFMVQLGWDCVGVVPFLDTRYQPCGVVVFQKR